MPAPDLTGAEMERGVQPSLFDRFLDLRREVADCRGSARQQVERADDISRQTRLIQSERLPDRGDVTLRVLYQQVDPVHQLDIRIAAHPGEPGGGLDRRQCRGVEPPE